MTAAILEKVNKLSLFSGNPTSPSNDDFITCLDYDKLEKDYCIHKYYPSYIHNGGITTPKLKSQIEHKPIYAKANAHVKKLPRLKTKGTSNSTKREANGSLCKTDITQAAKTYSDPPPYQVRDCRFSVSHREKVFEELKQKDKESREIKKRDVHEKLVSQHIEYVSDSTQRQPDMIEFKNPFNTNPPTLVTETETEKSHKRNNSFAGKLLSIVKGEFTSNGVRDGGFPLRKTNSYDQTKSTMTKIRSSKNRLQSLKPSFREDRRGSEQISE